jgi:hypothetical protein
MTGFVEEGANELQVLNFEIFSASFHTMKSSFRFGILI